MRPLRITNRSEGFHHITKCHGDILVISNKIKKNDKSNNWQREANQSERQAEHSSSLSPPFKTRRMEGWCQLCHFWWLHFTNTKLLLGMTSVAHL